MKNSRIFTFLAAFFLSVFFISCSGLFEARPSALVINLPQTAARAAYNPADISYYNVSATEIKTGAKEERLKCRTGKSVYFDSLDDGIYLVHADAFDKDENCIAISDDANPKHTIKINGQTTASVTVSMLKYFSAGSIKVVNSDGTEIFPVKGTTPVTFICNKGETLTLTMTPEDGVEPYNYDWTYIYTDANPTPQIITSNEPELNVTIAADSTYIFAGKVSDSAEEPKPHVSCINICRPDQAELTVKQENSIASVKLHKPFINFGSYKVLMDDEEIKTIASGSEMDATDTTFEVELNEAGEKTFTLEYSAELTDGSTFETQKTYTVTFDKIITGLDASLKSDVTKTSGYTIGDFIVSRLYKDLTQSAPLTDYSVTYKTTESGYVPVTIRDTESGFETVLNNIKTIWTADNSTDTPSVVNRSIKQNEAFALLAQSQGPVYPVNFYLTPGGEAQSLVPYSTAYQWYIISASDEKTAISGATDISYTHPANKEPGVYHYTCEATFIKNTDAEDFISFGSAETAKIFEAVITVNEYVGDIQVTKSFNGSDNTWSDVTDYISTISGNYEPVVIALEGTFTAETPVTIAYGKNPVIKIIAKESGAEIINKVSYQNYLFYLIQSCYFEFGGEGTGILAITG